MRENVAVVGMDGGSPGTVGSDLNPRQRFRRSAAVGGALGLDKVLHIRARGGEEAEVAAVRSQLPMLDELCRRNLHRKDVGARGWEAREVDRDAVLPCAVGSGAAGKLPQLVRVALVRQNAAKDVHVVAVRDARVLKSRRRRRRTEMHNGARERRTDVDGARRRHIAAHLDRDRVRPFFGVRHHHVVHSRDGAVRDGNRGGRRRNLHVERGSGSRGRGWVAERVDGGDHKARRHASLRPEQRRPFGG
mmetsp:Transcript_3305/g.11878  ORF Transcript_3305/g.11878 Transcript_3305/m.11878 type:complete len:247 (-) Transcript_3305:3259-3999(-)